MICQICSDIIKKGSSYYETWTPYPQIHCIECHKRILEKRKKEAPQ